MSFDLYVDNRNILSPDAVLSRGSFLHFSDVDSRFVNDVSKMPLANMWSDTRVKYQRGVCSLSDINLYEYERRAPIGKVELVMYQLHHIMADFDVSLKSIVHGCCEIFEAEAFKSELIFILSVIIHRVPGVHLSHFLFGYIKHSSCIYGQFLQSLILNESSEWLAVWNFFASMGGKLPTVAASIGCCFVETTGYPLTLESDVVPVLSRRIEYILRVLLSINKAYLGMAIEHLISSNNFPDLLLDALHLVASQSGAAALTYIKRLLLDSGNETRIWICGYLRKQSGECGHLEKLNAFFLNFCAQLISKVSSVSFNDATLLDGLTFLRVLAALRGFANYNFTPVLSSHLLSLLTHEVRNSDLGSQYITYSLAFLIGLRSSLITPEDTDVSAEPSMLTENRIVAWLQRLVHSSSDERIGSRSYVEPLLLLAILFHTNQPGPITDLISNLLGLRIPSLSRTVNGWRKVLLQSVFTESMITKHAAQMSITPALSRKMSTNLPIHCMLQLLKSHAFAKNKLELRGWITGQILESVRPLHPLLPDLIEAHVVHSLRASGTVGRVVDFSALISEADLMAHFSSSDKIPMSRFCVPAENTADHFELQLFDSMHSDLTPSLLLLYYALFVYDYQLVCRLAVSRSSSGESVAYVYSEQFWDRIPITHLLENARAHVSDYGPLYPRLLQLVTNHFPHLTVGELMIQDELLLDPIWCCEYPMLSTNSECEDDFTNPQLILNEDICTAHTNNKLCICTPLELDKAFDAALHEITDIMNNSDQAPSLATIPFFSCRRLIQLVLQVNRASSTTDVLLSFGSVIGSKAIGFMLKAQHHPLLLNNRRFFSTLGNLWCRLHLVMPRRLDILTITTLHTDQCRSASQLSGTILKTTKKLTGTDLKIDPVENIICSVNPAVFRCPPVLRIFLRVLESSLLASRSYWTHKLLDRVVPTSASITMKTTVNSSVAQLPTARPSVCISAVPTSLEASSATRTNDAPIGLTNGRFIPFTDEECEHFCSSMLLTQNAAVVQLLLERCLRTKEEAEPASAISVLREVRNEISTYIHYMFIAEPALAEVIVWQTYPHCLLPVSAQTIPSLHICLDHVLHVFRMSGDYAKLVFCLDLVSHLSLYYNIQSAFERAAFMLDSLYHLLTAVVSIEDRPDFLQACLPALLRLGRAFPSLAPLIARLLLTVAALIVGTLTDECRAELRVRAYYGNECGSLSQTPKNSTTDDGVACVQSALQAFDKLVTQSSLQRTLYYPPEPPLC